MNWGKKIAILYLSFVALIVTLVLISMNQEIELESKDYYAQELKYQEKIDALKNTNTLNSELSYERIENSLVINFPEEQKEKITDGEILFFCASDSEKDKKISLSINENNSQSISLNQLQKAKYTVKISWKCNTKNYFKEFSFTYQ
jgi:hypothetical protein